MAASHALVLTLGACHRRVFMLPRATIHFSSELMQSKDPEGQTLMNCSYVLGRRAFVMAVRHSCAELCAWLFEIYAICLGEAFQGFLLSVFYAVAPGRRRLVGDFHLLLLWCKTSRPHRFRLCLGGFCSAPMVRERARPRRGSAWDAHREQRRRKKQLERALSLASSILRQKARKEKRKLLDIIVERKEEGSREGSFSNLDNAREAEPEFALTTCIVEEDPTIGDLPGMEMPQAMEIPVRASTCFEYVPGCIVEEVPWSDEKTPGNEIGGEKSNAVADSGEETDVGNAPSNSPVDGLHGSLCSDEHLALIFEMRSHLADVELRLLLMSQRVDILLGALSGVPARIRCPTCAQEFAAPARYTRQATDGDDARD